MENNKILIVDDSIYIQALLKEIFTEGGLNVIGCCANADEAIEKFKELQPDIVSIDLILPGIDGIELMKKLKELNPFVKIIIISAFDKVRTIKEVLKLGAIDFIVKPINKNKVLKVIERVKNI